MSIYLASASPRRAELLQQIGVEFEQIITNIDESRHQGEVAEMYVLRLALEKARAGLAMLAEGELRPVLGADTVVVCDGEILGKPADREQAMAMLASLSGRSHRVMTAVAMVRADGEEHSRLSVSDVTLREVSPDEAQAYWHSGEPADKAGGYAIQGLAAIFIEHLEGSYSGVMGLPLYETAQMLAALGIPLLDKPQD